MITHRNAGLEAPYEYETPEVWVGRVGRLNDAIEEAATSGAFTPHVVENTMEIINSGLGEMAFIRGQIKKETWPHMALVDFERAFEACYLPAVFEIEHLLRTRTPAELRLSAEEFAEVHVAWIDLANDFRWNELESGLLTGTRPVMWQRIASAPSATNVRWGGGSLFMMQRGHQQFAVTARHVATNVGADTEHFRLLLPETRQILPVLPPVALEEQDPLRNEHQGDVLVWPIDVEGFNETAEWWSWRLEGQVRPASDLSPGQKIYCVGFPSFDESFDAENFDLVEHPFIMSGVLSDTQFVDGLFTMDIGQHLPEVDLNGMSGGPVFARFDDRFHYVGMAIRGVGKRLNFICSEQVLRVLNLVDRGVATGVEATV